MRVVRKARTGNREVGVTLADPKTNYPQWAMFFRDGQFTMLHHNKQAPAPTADELCQMHKLYKELSNDKS